MKVKVLGVGGATDKIPTAYIVNDNTLVDCGMGVVHKIIESKEIEQIKNVYITHIHMDHIGGFELLVYYWDYMKIKNINVYAGEEFWELYEKMACSKIKKPFKKNNVKNHFKVKHMGLEAYGFIFEEKGKRAIITGDTDFVIKRDTFNTKIFHDMGATEVIFPEHIYKSHVTENEVFKVYGKNENIIGVHTNANLKFYKKAKEGEIFIW